MRTRGVVTLFLAAAVLRADALGDALDDLHVQVLIATLGGEGDAAKESVATTLAGLGEPGVAALVRGLESRDPATRVRCAIALRGVTAPCANALPPLIALLGETTDDRTRNEIEDTLVLFGDVAQQHASFYLGATTGSGDMPRRFGYLGLARIGPTPETVPAMIAGLSDSDRQIQSIAVTVLAPKDWWSMIDRWDWPSPVYDPAPWPALWTEPGLARHRAAVLERLVPLLRHPDDGVRALAANGLGRAEAPLPDAALQALTRALADEDGDVGWRAAVALAQLSERGLAPPAFLLSMLQSGDTTQQQLAAEAAWRLGSDAAWATTAVRNVWDTSESWGAKAAAAGFLGRLGIANDEMIGWLAADYFGIDPSDSDQSTTDGRRSSTPLERRDALVEKLRATKGAYEILVEVAKGTRRIEGSGQNGGHTPPDRRVAIRALEAFPERKAESIAVVEEILGAPGPLDVHLRSIEFLLRQGAANEACEERLGPLVDRARGYDLVRATELLLRVDPGARRAVPRLLRALSKGDARGAARLLARIGRLPAIAKAPLLRAAVYGDEETRHEAVRALGNLEDPDEEVRDFLWTRMEARSVTSWAAASALAALARSPDDIQRLIKARWLPPLSDPARTAEICDAISRLGLDDGDLPSVLRALDEAAPESALARSLHLRVLGSDSDVLAYQRVYSLRWLIDHGPRGEPSLLTLLTQRLLAPGCEGLTGAALVRIAEPQDLARIAAALETALHMPETKREALAALGALGPKARSAIPAIRALEADLELAPLARKARAEIER